MTGKLGYVPTWKVVIDPRNGNIYVGNDNGVYMLTARTGTWKRFGAGLPIVQVKELDLNLTTNVLSAGIYCRSMFQIFLDDVQANSGALRAVSGSTVCTGPIRLAGNPTTPVTISANGTQALQNGIAAAQLNVIGTISD